MSADSANDPGASGEAQGDDELYVLREPEVRSATPPRGGSVFHPSSAVAAGERRREALAAGASVDEIWSPISELWRPLALAAVVFGLGIAIWWLPKPAAVAVCLAGLAFTGYWVAVTLDRPVRLTPEQAVREYLECLTHWVPNYRRMWLLLSSLGKQSADYNSFPTFRAYWSHKLARLRPPGSGLRPLEFRVDHCDAVYNEDRSAAAVECLVRVFVRGFESAPPLAELEWKNSVTKGPDGMWYLDDGRLPEAAEKAQAGDDSASQVKAAK